MNPGNFPVLLPALPEIILALGAMGLLMYGAFQGERSGGVIDTIAFVQ